jgi:3'(2'), 5'-bisphosphate nucleotidase
MTASNTFDCARLADALLETVLAVGRLQIAIRREGVAAELKADRSPVTRADRESEELIEAALALHCPGLTVIGEEAIAGGRRIEPGHRFALVDPLDGTREYVKGGDDFTVNIAIIRDRTPEFGLIYAPASGWLFVTLGPDRVVEARIQPGAVASRMHDLELKPVRTRRPDADGLVAVASRSHLSERDQAFLDRLAVKSRVSIGSSLKFCLVARGDADVYPRLSSISEWDTAAGYAVLAAAGGIVLSPEGGAITYGDAASGFRCPPFVAWGRRPAH